MKNILKLALLATVTLSFIARAEGEGQANNPLANSKAFNIQNYYIGDFTDVNGDSAGLSGNQTWIRYAQPFSFGDSQWILRASLPFNRFPAGGDYDTGVGDLNVFLAYLIKTNNPAVSFGVGPQVTAPTASKETLGSDKWSAGLVNVFFNGSSPRFQYGYLLSWQQSIAGDDKASDVNVAAFQPFTFYQLGGGYYLRSAPFWIYDLENDNYNIPLGLGIGKVIKTDYAVFNTFVESQYSVWSEGASYPKWQIFAGINMQF